MDKEEERRILRNKIDQIPQRDKRIRPCKKNIINDYQNSKAYRLCGDGFRKIKNYEKSIRNYAIAVQIDSHSNSEVWYGYGVSLTGLKKYEEVNAKFFRAVLIKPTAEIYFYWDWSLYKLKNYEEAITRFSEAVCLRPNFKLGHYEWGVSLYRVSRFEEAYIKLVQAIIIGPSNIDAHYYLAMSLYKLNRFDGAIIEFEIAINAKNHEIKACYYMGISFYRLNRFEEACSKFAKVLSLAYDYTEAHYYLGMSLYKLRNFEEASKFEESIRLKSNHLLPLEIPFENQNRKVSVKAGAVVIVKLETNEETHLGNNFKFTSCCILTHAASLDRKELVSMSFNYYVDWYETNGDDPSVLVLSTTEGVRAIGTSIDKIIEEFVNARKVQKQEEQIVEVKKVSEFKGSKKMLIVYFSMSLIVISLIFMKEMLKFEDV